MDLNRNPFVIYCNFAGKIIFPIQVRIRGQDNDSFTLVNVKVAQEKDTFRDIAIPRRLSKYETSIVTVDGKNCFQNICIDFLDENVLRGLGHGLETATRSSVADEDRKAAEQSPQVLITLCYDDNWFREFVEFSNPVKVYNAACAFRCYFPPVSVLVLAAKAVLEFQDACSRYMSIVHEIGLLDLDQTRTAKEWARISSSLYKVILQLDRSVPYDIEHIYGLQISRRFLTKMICKTADIFEDRCDEFKN